ncbi:tRNA-uridine aminocarboxypropyltransferase [Motilimonas sp. E26]|uniref:tRNA-uridine aminocarboxypropyltransferase n=1 Tax=Motilimonas sp. E26 TaxID=2865674 RepID=UPI001E5D6C40|nr:tRNA-uridine aminocarboxypropyltransferase [Motilimonas sp. E26]MCE0558456.1 DTW domain-containing protein [Motilimonas sp. E26]
MSETHAVQRLYQARMQRVTRPYLARGANVVRCKLCMINAHLCICAHRPSIKSQAAFMLVMYDDEVLKPSNTGRLIADVASDCHAYIWSRTEPERAMLDTINDPKYQAFVVFPGEYAASERVVSQPEVPLGKIPLFILLDASWSQARKMFKKSPWLAHLPVLSFAPDLVSRYLIRKSVQDHQLATAEVAALVYDSINEPKNGALMNAWFDVFKEHYLTGKMQRQLPEQGALQRLALLQGNNAADIT